MKNQPTIPWSPQPLEELQARLPKALQRVFDADQIADEIEAGDFSNAPAKKQEHVFDTTVGIRLIISMEKVEGMLTSSYLHISYSAHESAIDRMIAYATSAGKVLTFQAAIQVIDVMALTIINRLFPELPDPIEKLRTEGYITHLAYKYEPTNNRTANN